MSAPLAGFGTILRHNARLDRIRLPFWILGIIALPLSAYGTYDFLFPTAQQQANANLTVGANPALLFLFGPSDLSTAGGFTSFRSVVFGGLFVALMAILTVVRHTRAEEDAGRAELVASARVGRYTFLISAFALAATTSLAVGALTGLGLVALGADATGAAFLGASFVFTGFVFAGVAAISVQLGAFARTATSIALAVLGTSYLIRAWGDSSTSLSWISWTSPLGWTVKVQPFSNNDALPLVLMFAGSGVAVVVAMLLRSRRDLGMGVLPPRDGHANAPRYLRSGFGLATRLQSPGFISWGIGLMIAGVVVGSISGSLSDVLGNSGFGDAFAGDADFASAFLSTLISVLGILAASYGIQATLRARTEETDDRVEPLLATPLSRVRWLGGHLLFGFAGSALVVLTAGVALGLTAQASGTNTPFTDIVAAAATQTAASWVLVGLATALVGAAPRMSFLALPAVAVSLVLTIFGPLLNVGDVVLAVSPFYHLPDLPGGSFKVGPVVALLAIAAGLAIAGLIGIRQRDIA
jgi:ABC-2 type transport system permease protein